MSGSRSTTQTSTAEPWKPAQPYLQHAMADTQNVYQSGQGFDYFPGSTVVPYANQSLQAFQGIENLANQGNPLASAAQSNALNVIQGGGMTPEARQALEGTYQTALGNNQIGTEGDYRNQLQGADDMLGGYARGDYITGGSPQFNAALNYQSGQLTDDINRGFSNAGRYGSGAHVNQVGDAVGRFRNEALAGEIQREQALQQTAANSLMGNQQAGLGAITGVQGANIANQVGAGSTFADQLRAGQGLAGTFSGMAGDLYNQQFAPYQQLAGVGAQYEDLATRSMQDSINRWDSAQQAPWQRLANYNALLTGAGQLGSTGSTTVPGPSRLQTGLGGAFTGAQLGSSLGLPGLLGGALLGGLGGAIF